MSSLIDDKNDNDNHDYDIDYDDDNNYLLLTTNAMPKKLPVFTQSYFQNANKCQTNEQASYKGS